MEDEECGNKDVEANDEHLEYICGNQSSGNQSSYELEQSGGDRKVRSGELWSGEREVQSSAEEFRSGNCHSGDREVQSDDRPM